MDGWVDGGDVRMGKVQVGGRTCFVGGECGVRGGSEEWSGSSEYGAVRCGAARCMVTPGVPSGVR